MGQSGAYVERRKHPRAPLHLPARIRWQGPLGMRVEMTKTVEASREGVLVHRSQPCELLTRVWIVFPYDRSAGASVQPETPGRIARVAQDKAGGYWVAVQLETQRRGRARAAGDERRRSERVPFALPIFIRLEGTPWPEESMTHDLSLNGARFETSHIYAAGDTVIAQIPWGEWSKKGEIRGRVVRVENIPDSPSPALAANVDKGVPAIITAVAVEWLNAMGPRGGSNRDFDGRLPSAHTRF